MLSSTSFIMLKALNVKNKYNKNLEVIMYFESVMKFCAFNLASEFKFGDRHDFYKLKKRVENRIN